MDICVVFQLYLAMAQVHMDVPGNHVKIANAGTFLQKQCEEFEKKEKSKNKKKEPKIKESQIESIEPGVK